MSAYLAVFISSLLWAISTQIYAKMVQKLTVYRFNFYKSIIAFACFFIVCIFTGNFYFPKQAMPYLLLSGFLGFTLADLFIFYSFSKNGPARTMIFSSFSPSIIAIYSYFILGKTLPSQKVVGLFFLLLCLLFIALERKNRGNVSLRVALLAIIGINIEALGVVFTKKSFMVMPDLSPFTANLYRVGVAVIILGVVNSIKGVKFGIADLDFGTKGRVLSSTFLGTFLALYFYLYAISHYSHPSIIAGIGSLAPIYASIYEHCRDKKRPNRYFMGAIISMICGVLFLIFG